MLIVFVLVAVLAAYCTYHFARQAADDRGLHRRYWGWITWFCISFVITEGFTGAALSKIPYDKDLKYLLFWTFAGGLLATATFALWALRLRRLDLLLGLFASFVLALSAIVWRELL